jgi:hypothetical protein
MRKIIIMFILILFISPAQAVQVIPKPREAFTCVDYSLEFAQKNPDWGIVTLSNNQLFRGVTHMVNYQFTKEGYLKIHDGMYQADYILCGWQGTQFYHFWLESETPCRNYRVLQDNSNLFIEKV